MIRIEHEETKLKVFFSGEERVTIKKAKKLLRLGCRISKQQETSALIIELNNMINIDQSALNLINKIFNKTDKLPIVVISS
jgi:hypothetical protein